MLRRSYGLNQLLMCSRYNDPDPAPFQPSPWWSFNSIKFAAAPFWLRKRRRGRIIYRQYRRQ